MKNEINKDRYCGGDHYKDGWCLLGDCVHVDNCSRAHRKWPTPEQFREEYGEEYPDSGAMYVLLPHGSKRFYWSADEFGAYIASKEIIVCACTPFGKPDKDWRP